MKGLISAFIVVALLYGVYQFTFAAYGWFQMTTVVDDIAGRELRGIAERHQQQRSLFESDRYAKLREGILKGAEEAGVPLSPENVNISVSDNVLDIRLSWGAPIITYQGKIYLQLPMTMQRGFSLIRY